MDGNGGARRIGWPDVEQARVDGGALWVHLDRSTSFAQSWLSTRSGIDSVAAEALAADASRPRVERLGDGLLMSLRGVNLNPGSNPEDMVSLRFWAEDGRLITVRRRKLMAVQDVRDALEEGRGPRTVAELVLTLAGRLLDRMGPALAELEDGIDQLEEAVLSDTRGEQRLKLSLLRRQTILLRRYIAPQRDVMGRLQVERLAWLGETERLRARELQDRVTRYVEDLDAARDRAQVVQEEVAHRLAERMNRTMYVLSIVAAIFLPLTLLTGLLGINVGGIPGSSAQGAFAIVTVALLILALAEAWLFHRARWL